MIEFSNVQSDVHEGWSTCILNNISPYIKTPLIHVEPKELEALMEHEEELISVFNECTYELFSLNCCRKFIFLLFDKNFHLLSRANYTDDKSILDAKKLVLGTSFDNKSIGLNSVSLAAQKDWPIFLEANQHFCVFMRDFHSSAMPLKMSGQAIGYLCIMTTNEDSVDEFRFLIDLLSSAMMNKLHLQQCRKHKNMLSKLQLKVLSFLANGKTEAEIAEELQYSIQTIKYHKHEIYRKFEVKNTPDAVTKLYKYNDSQCDYK